MKENDYYGHYKAFVKELNSKPDQTLQIYCRENGVVWRAVCMTGCVGITYPLKSYIRRIARNEKQRSA